MPFRKKKDDTDDELIVRAQARLEALIDAEAVEREAELERTLALARSESAALLAQAERRLAEERRAELVERERRILTELSGRLVGAQKDAEAKLAAWAQDLERARESLGTQLSRLEARQKHLMAEAETRFTRETERLASDTEEHRAALARVRVEIDRAVKDAVESARNELETHAAERRRALHEVAERLRKRERDLTEQIEREQTEISRRLTETFAGVERRQVEQLERSLAREASRFAEAAAHEFDTAIKGAREEAARRLSRELERSVQSFTREAERVLAEQLAKVGDSGGQSFQRRLQQLSARISELEGALRERVGTSTNTESLMSNFGGQGSSTGGRTTEAQ
jgi:hypothetical protein